MGQKSYRWELSIWQELLENTFPCWKRQVLFTIITDRMATSCGSKWCPCGLLGGMGRAEGIVQEEAVGSILWSSARSVRSWSSDLHWYRARYWVTGDSSTEKDLGSWWNELNRSQQCARAVGKARHGVGSMSKRVASQAGGDCSL